MYIGFFPFYDTVTRFNTKSDDSTVKNKSAESTHIPRNYIFQRSNPNLQEEILNKEVTFLKTEIQILNKNIEYGKKQRTAIEQSYSEGVKKIKDQYEAILLEEQEHYDARMNQLSIAHKIEVSQLKFQILRLNEDQEMLKNEYDTRISNLKNYYEKKIE
jgi:hypothetical protein